MSSSPAPSLQAFDSSLTLVTRNTVAPKWNRLLWFCCTHERSCCCCFLCTPQQWTRPEKMHTHSLRERGRVPRRISVPLTVCMPSGCMTPTEAVKFHFDSSSLGHRQDGHTLSKLANTTGTVAAVNAFSSHKEMCNRTPKTASELRAPFTGESSGSLCY